MTSAFPLHRYTYQDYVWLEEESSTRHEFLFGEITAMVRGTPEHAAMAAELIGQLREQLEGKPCRVFTSDLGVRVMATGLATYPDASVVCGPTQRDPEKKTNVLNPRVLVEITSDSTEAYDRGEKLAHYQRIPSLEAVVIVSHREACVEVWSRPAGSRRGRPSWRAPERPPRSPAWARDWTSIASGGPRPSRPERGRAPAPARLQCAQMVGAAVRGLVGNQPVTAPPVAQRRGAVERDRQRADAGFPPHQDDRNAA